MMILHGGDGEGPCGFMRGFLDRAADGRERGLRAWYARAHASLCPGCGRYLRSLSSLVVQLAQTRDESTDEDALARLRERAGL